MDETRLIREEDAQLRQVALRACFEEFSDGRRLPLVDFGFQSAPTREAMLARDIQESRCEFRLRIVATQLGQSIPGQLFQILE